MLQLVHLTKLLKYQTLKWQTLNLIQGIAQGDRKGFLREPTQRAHQNILTKPIGIWYLYKSSSW